ncbi:MAG: NAD(P)/FAD-dependent oxidoreductase [Actinobacteria bacterium]|nr:NAD(P)/FAD-dependent oxidoreductase [Actinomycetota bacterium]
MNTEIKNIKKDYLIIGNSAAGISAAESIRKNDKKASIAILTMEKYPNYSKPLITYYLAGKLDLDRINFKDRDFYKKNNIELCLEKKAVMLNPQERFVLTGDGSKYFYKKLLIACGAKPAIPPIKVRDENESVSSLDREIGKIRGAFTLTTLEDAVEIKKYINDYSIKSASILGGGLIGLKAAEAFLELGININVIELSEMLLSASFDKTASGIIEDRIKQAGSNIITGQTIEEIIINNGAVLGLKLTNGNKIKCSLLIVAAGVLPDDAIFKDTAIKTDKGIIVNEKMQTSIPDIYAAGDAVKSYDILSGQPKNLAIWPAAVRQGSVAGMNMSGRPAIYKGGFLMNSVEILGVPVISLGLSNAEINASPAEIKVYIVHDALKKIYRKILVRNDRIIGVILLGAIERAGIYYGLIYNSIDISELKDKVAREDFGIIQLPADYRKHLVVGEGIEV